ncbi:hypothetical protein [Roseovarius sp. 2305UL8-3]|uniref:hypothetical protein n=1 Tax=Roseovarius conchicola TaxID=3121636 RepID=UPI003528205E
MRRALSILIVLCVATVLLYLSRFWPLELWGRRSALGELGLRPGGGMVQFWLRGTPLAQFDLIIWVVGSFITLSLTEKLVQWLSPTKA